MARNEYLCDCSAVNPELVQDVLNEIPKDSTFLHMSNLYKIMGDQTRCKIIFSLLKHELCVCDLANVLSMSKSAISHQLKKMRESKILKARRVGKQIYYSIDDEHISSMFENTMTHVKHL